MPSDKVFVTRLIPAEGIQLIEQNAQTEVWPERGPPPRDVLLDKVKGVGGILSMLSDKIDAEVMDAAGPDLKVISNYAVGIDNIDVAEASSRGIVVGNTPGVLTETTADVAWALILGGARRVGEAHDYIRKGKWIQWEPMELLGLDVFDKTLGVIGMGAIGQATARRAKGFNMKVIYYDHKSRPELGESSGAEMVSFEEVLTQSDFLSLNCPLTDVTRGLIGAKELAMMKDTAILVNTARGPVVDSGALYKALKEGTIAYAALDVTDPEPINMDNPLLELDNCLMIPHIGSASVATRTKMSMMAATNLLEGLKGNVPPNCVNPQVRS